MANSLDEIAYSYLTAVEDGLKSAVKRSNIFGETELYEMLAYHMGWRDQGEHVEGRGKRIRPLIVLLACAAAGGDWLCALPGATAVELVHNFSLIHDDIEDHSPLRRGRETIWKKWGVPQAINCGDAMLTLAHLEANRLAETVTPRVALQVVEILQRTCLHLTIGQHLDLTYETLDDLSIDHYWQMVEGKTAALISASAEIGALAARGDDKIRSVYHEFGRLLGLAFQVQDDILGIWGDSTQTGKSNQSDLATGKKTLPVLYGIAKGGKFADEWLHRPFSAQEIPGVADLLEHEGGKDYAQSQAEQLVNQALASLNDARPEGEAGKALVNLALGMVSREI